MRYWVTIKNVHCHDGCGIERARIVKEVLSCKLGFSIAFPSFHVPKYNSMSGMVIDSGQYDLVLVEDQENKRSLAVQRSCLSRCSFDKPLENLYIQSRLGEEGYWDGTFDSMYLQRVAFKWGVPETYVPIGQLLADLGLPLAVLARELEHLVLMRDGEKWVLPEGQR